MTMRNKLIEAAARAVTRYTAYLEWARQQDERDVADALKRGDWLV